MMSSVSIPRLLERLVHLLPALHRDVKIAFAAEEKGRRLDAVGMQERVGDLDVGIECLPGRADFIVVLR